MKLYSLIPKVSKTEKENKMTNKDLRPQLPKKPLKVEVKVALPWILIVLAVAIIASLITGWNLRSEDINRVKAEASSIVEVSKPQSKE